MGKLNIFDGASLAFGAHKKSRKRRSGKRGGGLSAASKGCSNGKAEKRGFRKSGKKSAFNMCVAAYFRSHGSKRKSR